MLSLISSKNHQQITYILTWSFQKTCRIYQRITIRCEWFYGTCWTTPANIRLAGAQYRFGLGHHDDSSGDRVSFTSRLKTKGLAYRALKCGPFIRNLCVATMRKITISLGPALDCLSSDRS